MSIWPYFYALVLFLDTYFFPPSKQQKASTLDGTGCPSCNQHTYKRVQMLEAACSGILWLDSRCEGEKQKPASVKNMTKRNPDAEGNQSKEKAEGYFYNGDIG